MMLKLIRYCLHNASNTIGNVELNFSRFSQTPAKDTPAGGDSPNRFTLTERIYTEQPAKRLLQKPTQHKLKQTAAAAQN